MLSLLANQLSLAVTAARGRLQREEGATAVEYGIMVALIAVAIIVTVGVLGTTLDGVFQGVVDALPAAE